MSRFPKIARRSESAMLVWERALRYYTSTGYQIVKEGKYIFLSCGSEDKIFLGKAGAIREGKKVTESYSIADTAMEKILEWELTNILK